MSEERAGVGGGAASGSGPNSDELIVYCRSWCGDCRRAKAWLEERGIAYVEVDVEDDDEAREHCASLNEGRLHTPTFELGGEVCVDFRPERIRELLDLP